MKKGFAFGVAALTLCTAISATAFAITADEAKTAAQKVLPADATLVETKVDDGKYELKFYSADRTEKYDVDISQALEKMVSFESELVNDLGGRTVTISEDAAKKAVTGEIADAEILYTALEYDDGFSVYEVSFQADGCYGSYEIHTETGKILKRDIHIGSIPTKPTLQQKPQVPSGSDIGIDKAREIALSKAPAGAQLHKIKLDRDDGRTVYEGELRNGAWEYEFTIDAATGTILEWDQDYDD